MAASMGSRFCQRTLQKFCKNSVRHPCFCHFNRRTYARGIRRDIQRVMTVEDENRQWNDRKNLKDPKKNAFIPYESGDPVQQSLIEQYNNKMKRKKVGNTKPQKSVHIEKFVKQQKGEIHVYTRRDKTELKYKKLEDGDERFGRLIMAAKSRKEREKLSLILLEGFRLIQDALDAGATAKCLYFSDRDFLNNLTLDDPNIELYKVQYRHLKLWADTQSPSGIMAVFEKPKQGECLSPADTCLPLTLICDNVRDPGNMGTLIRTAAAVGCRRVLATKGCVDVWEPKVLRAGMGSHFHIPIITGIPWEIVLNYVDDNSQVFIADTKQSADRRPPTLPLPDIVDADGPTIGTAALATYQEKYPLDMQKHLSVDEAYLDKVHVKQFNQVPMHYVGYDSLKCTEKDVTVLIGGETTGVTEAAKKFAFDRFGQCVTIPMSPAVNSLNSAIAGSIILYEIRKQLMAQR